LLLDVPYKRVASIQTELLDNVLNAITEEDWFTDDYRNSVGNMVSTNSIPILHTPLCASGLRTMSAINDIKPGPLYDKYYPLIEPIVQELEKYYTFNKLAVFISRLHPKSQIGEHHDGGLFLELCHRVHVPLKTNPDVHYYIEKVPYYWEKGTIFEFNNLLSHSVDNTSDEERIHIVFNLYNLE